MEEILEALLGGFIGMLGDIAEELLGNGLEWFSDRRDAHRSRKLSRQERKEELAQEKRREAYRIQRQMQIEAGRKKTKDL